MKKKKHKKNFLKLKTFKNKTPSLTKILLFLIKNHRDTG